MAEFNKVEFSQNKRKELGISREKLADGICDTTTLMRFEKGKINISEDKYEKLQIKLGQPIESFSLPQGLGLFVDYLDYVEYEKLLRNRSKDILVENVSELERRIQDFTGIEKHQFIGRIKLFSIKEDKERYLNCLEDLLRESVPEYNNRIIPQNRIYNCTELSLLLSIAIAYKNLGEFDNALELYEQIMKYYSTAVSLRDDLVYNKIVVAYSNCLGLAGQYDKSMELIFDALSWMQKNSSQEMLFNYLFNVGWLLEEMWKKNNINEYHIKARKVIEQSIALAEFFDESEKAIKQMKNYYDKEFC